jgi:hypothetical protein|tara:strand:- start:4001 stop:6307 length:2307 start_codon:yes stop_codon:yes gene_type:complete
MDLECQYWEDVSELVTEKDRVRRTYDEREEREEITRDFYNGRPIMVEDDADEEDLENMTNHLIGYSSLQVLETRLYSIWSTSNRIIDVDVVEKVNESEDIIEIERRSKLINKYMNKAIYHTSRFGAFWRAVSGEIVIAGRAACIYDDDSDWCPRVKAKLMFPDNLGTDIREMTYAFSPDELTLDQLRALLGQGDTDDEEDDGDDFVEGVQVNKEAIEGYINEIKKQIKMDGKSSYRNDTRAKRKSTDTDEEDRNNKTTVDAWRYYEIRYDEDLESRVVDMIIFTEQLNTNDKEESTQVVLAKFPAYYEAPERMGHLIVLDAKIGGEKRFSEAKGIADITYNSDVDSEELLNNLFEGEKARAIPRLQIGEGANTEELLGWDVDRDRVVPSGVQEFQLRTPSGNLQTPLALMSQNSASIAGASFSNSGRGGELRQQAVERQDNNRATGASRLADALKSLDILLHEVARRFMSGDIEPGEPGYEDIMWFRAKMKKHNIPIEELAEQTYGYFDYIEVKAVRSSSSGENDFDLQVAQQLMQNIGNYPPAVRPFIVNKFTSLITSDPQFADRLVELLPKISSAQRITSEIEFEQIARDASIGLETPLGAEDVHQEHIPTHFKHLEVILARANFRPWTREDAAHFAGIQLHTEKHITELLQNGTTQAEGQQFAQEFARLVSQADGLLQEVEQEEASFEEQAGMTQAEKDERELQLKEREQSRKEADTQSTIEQRERRQSGIDRKGDQDFLIKKAQTEQSRAAQAQQTQGNNNDNE